MKNINNNEIIDLYKNGKSLSQIGLIFKVNAATIFYRLKKLGLKLRTYSESLKGRTITPEWREKIKLKSLGKTISEKTKEKISITKKSCHYTSWSKGLSKSNNPDLINLGHPGPSHWNWKGGISSINRRLRQTSEYKKWRKEVFKLDNNTCQFCEKKSKHLHAHHLIPVCLLMKFEDLKSLIYDPYNGYTLCKECHEEFHREKIRPFEPEEIDYYDN
ncbi:MAG: hypothetical protein NTW30_05095 [Candidatus Aenigmarchaeota archaeon]|nr:hypothetical protein [Candidatus Aenigmarchaeota archaeon]